MCPCIELESCELLKMLLPFLQPVLIFLGSLISFNRPFCSKRCARCHEDVSAVRCVPVRCFPELKVTDVPYRTLDNVPASLAFLADFKPRTEYSRGGSAKVLASLEFARVPCGPHGQTLTSLIPTRHMDQINLPSAGGL
jgi:hypothetical protein